MKRAVFLDRDGVINRAIVRNGKPFAPLSTIEVEILPGVPQAILALRAAGFLTIVVTNQPDVGRGKLSQTIAETINAEIQAASGVDEVLACYHSGDEDCACRKPKPGMLLQAAYQYGLSLLDSFMVGDRWRDIAAGKAAGCTTIWIRSDYSEKLPDEPHAIVDSLLEASLLITSASKSDH